MSKKLYLLVGLALILALGAIIYWKFEWPHQHNIVTKSSGQPKQDSCAHVKFPFACYLDKAMAADDFGLCYEAGIDKRVNCLESYAEIKGTPIDCNKLTDPKFQLECQAAFKHTEQPDVTPTESPTPTKILILPGLGAPQK